MHACHDKYTIKSKTQYDTTVSMSHKIIAPIAAKQK